MHITFSPKLQEVRKGIAYGRNRIYLREMSLTLNKALDLNGPELCPMAVFCVPDNVPSGSF
jgi:hypothetical protein